MIQNIIFHYRKTKGEGRKTKFFITERCRGLASWIRFGEEGMRKLLMGVEACCREIEVKGDMAEGR